MQSQLVHETLLDAAERAARALEAEALRIRQEAKSRAAVCSQRIAAENTATAAAFVADLVEDGVCPDQAIREASARLGVPTDSIAYAINHHNRAQTVLARWHRDREIIRLARTMSNAEIAGQLGVSTATVSRVIRRVYRDAAHGQTVHRTPTDQPR